MDVSDDLTERKSTPECGRSETDTDRCFLQSLPSQLSGSDFADCGKEAMMSAMAMVRSLFEGYIHLSCPARLLTPVKSEPSSSIANLSR